MTDLECSCEPYENMPDCPIHGENTIVKLRERLAKLEAERDELKAKVAQLRTRFHEQEQWDE